MDVPSPKVAQKGIRKEQIAELFNSISAVYDRLNHSLSLGVDIWWRKKAIETLRQLRPQKILDVATGTGDFAVAASALYPTSIVGMDISEGMLAHARRKVARLGLAGVIELATGDAENLPFSENHFDAVTVAFGVRNFEHLESGLAEMLRVTRPGGLIAILEFSNPRAPVFRRLYQFYFTAILPRIGRRISRHQDAYSYLPASVKRFPEREEFVAILSRLGYKDISCTPFTLGVCALYLGSK